MRLCGRRETWWAIIEEQEGYNHWNDGDLPTPPATVEDSATSTPFAYNPPPSELFPNTLTSTKPRDNQTPTLA